MHCECQAEALQPQLIQRCSGVETLLGARWVQYMDIYIYDWTGLKKKHIDDIRFNTQEEP